MMSLDDGLFACTCTLHQARWSLGPIHHITECFLLLVSMQILQRRSCTRGPPALSHTHCTTPPTRTCRRNLSSSTQGCFSSMLHPSGPGPSSTTGMHTPPPPSAAAAAGHAARTPPPTPPPLVPGPALSSAGCAGAAVLRAAGVLRVAGGLCVLSTSLSRSCLAVKLGLTARGWDTSSRAREPSSATTDRMLPAPAGLREQHRGSTTDSASAAQRCGSSWYAWCLCSREHLVHEYGQRVLTGCSKPARKLLLGNRSPPCWHPVYKPPLAYEGSGSQQMSFTAPSRDAAAALTAPPGLILPTASRS